MRAVRRYTTWEIVCARLAPSLATLCPRFAAFAAYTASCSSPLPTHASKHILYDDVRDSDGRLVAMRRRSGVEYDMPLPPAAQGVPFPFPPLLYRDSLCPLLELPLPLPADLGELNPLVPVPCAFPLELELELELGCAESRRSSPASTDGRLGRLPAIFGRLGANFDVDFAPGAAPTLVARCSPAPALARGMELPALEALVPRFECAVLNADTLFDADGEAEENDAPTALRSVAAASSAQSRAPTVTHSSAGSSLAPRGYSRSTWDWWRGYGCWIVEANVVQLHRVSGTDLPRALIWALHNVISFRIELTRNYFQWFYVYSPCDWLIKDRPGAGPEVARPAVHPSLPFIGIKLVIKAYTVVLRSIRIVTRHTAKNLRKFSRASRAQPRLTDGSNRLIRESYERARWSHRKSQKRAYELNVILQYFKISGYMVIVEATEGPLRRPRGATEAVEAVEAPAEMAGRGVAETVKDVGEADQEGGKPVAARANREQAENAPRRRQWTRTGGKGAGRAARPREGGAKEVGGGEQRRAKPRLGYSERVMVPFELCGVPRRPKAGGRRRATSSVVEAEAARCSAAPHVGRVPGEQQAGPWFGMVMRRYMYEEEAGEAAAGGGGPRRGGGGRPTHRCQDSRAGFINFRFANFKSLRAGRKFPFCIPLPRRRYLSSMHPNTRAIYFKETVHLKSAASTHALHTSTHVNAVNAALIGIAGLWTRSVIQQAQALSIIFSFLPLLRVHFIVDLVNVFWVANPIWVAKNCVLMSPLFTQPTFTPIKT
ncbi:hypothetical protein DFH08DRAFT_1001833 [Mycena albidolilacea]|uniref:Uncharacterized protein n=1 Tax=Mycena albidolilacea TaxID=1033008 RepID=A0AAD7A0K2_9AGAR|nr:hypothetical protein DFH08DRAFT_1001833 [Mycena albidolilacea]